MPRSLTGLCARLPCTPTEWQQAGDGHQASYNEKCVHTDLLFWPLLGESKQLQFRVQILHWGYRAWPYSTAISQLFCRGCTEKRGEWLCWIYNYTPVSVPWLNPHGFLVVINEVISFYWSFGESKLIYLFHFNMEEWKVGIAPSPRILFFVRKTLIFSFVYI